MRKVEWERHDEAIPACLAVILMPLTSSVTMGIAYGFLSVVVITVLTERFSDVKPAMLVVAALCVLILGTV